jgi:hypothetical protein
LRDKIAAPERTPAGINEFQLGVLFVRHLAIVADGKSATGLQ